MNKVFLIGMFLAITAVMMSFGCLENDGSVALNQYSTKGDVIALTNRLQFLQNTMMNLEGRLDSMQNRLGEIQRQQRESMDLVQSLKSDIRNPSSNKIQIVIATDGSTGPTRTFNSIDEAVQFLNTYR